MSLTIANFLSGIAAAKIWLKQAVVGGSRQLPLAQFICLTFCRAI
jgi:hypothetical protein